MRPVLSAERRITEGECRERAERVKTFAAEHGLAAIVAFSATRAAMWNQTGHVGYISNWSNLDRNSECAVVIPVQGDPVLLYTGLPALIPQIRQVSWLSDIRVTASPDPGSVSVTYVDPDAPDEPGTTYGGITKQILVERGLTGRPVGLVAATTTPHGVYRSLKRALGDLLVDDVPDIIASLRAIKSPAEIALQRHAASLIDLGFERLMHEVRADRWGHQVVAQGEAAMRSEGADYAHFWMSSSPPTRWHDPLDIRPHDRLLEDGDQFALGGYVVYAGYWIQAMRTGSIGRPCPALEALTSAASRMVDAAAAVTRPGLPAVGAVRACVDVAEQTGYRLAAPRIGHGHGLDYSERPFLVRGSTDTLEAGNVVVFHPQIEDGETGTMLVPVGEVGLVTERGVELLTSFPRQPFVSE